MRRSMDAHDFVSESTCRRGNKESLSFIFTYRSKVSEQETLLFCPDGYHREHYDIPLWERRFYLNQTTALLLLLFYLCWCFRAPLRTDQRPAGYNVEAESPQDQQGSSPGVRLHQQLKERVESEGGEADAGEPQSQSQGTPASEISHDCGHHGSEDHPPSKTWSTKRAKYTVRGKRAVHYFTS